MFTIVRKDENGANKTPLPGEYGDRHQAMQALDKVLAGYAKHGENGEHDYWWARDDKGHNFRFFIEH